MNNQLINWLVCHFSVTIQLVHTVAILSVKYDEYECKKNCKATYFLFIYMAKPKM